MAEAGVGGGGAGSVLFLNPYTTGPAVFHPCSHSCALSEVKSFQYNLLPKIPLMIAAYVVYDTGLLSVPTTKTQGIFYIPKRNRLKTLSLSHKYLLGHNSGSFQELKLWMKLFIVRAMN